MPESFFLIENEADVEAFTNMLIISIFSLIKIFLVANKMKFEENFLEFFMIAKASLKLIVFI